MSGLTINELRGRGDMARMIADRRLYLTADKDTVVEEGDPDAAFLLAGEGSTIPPGEADRLGLSSVDGRVVHGDEEPVEEEEEGSTESEPDESETEIRVKQSGSWYTGYRDGEEVFKVQGEDAMKEAVAELEG